MRGTHLTRAHVAMELGRLLRVFKRPAHAPSDLATYAGDFAEICNDVSAEQFTQAVSAYLKGDHQFMPKPGQLRWFARQQPGAAELGGAGAPQPAFDTWLRGDWSTPCPACGAAWEPTPGGRRVLVHDHSRHVELGLPCVLACTAPPPPPGRKPCVGRPLERGQLPERRRRIATAEEREEAAAIQAEGNA